MIVVKKSDEYVLKSPSGWRTLEALFRYEKVSLDDCIIVKNITFKDKNIIEDYKPCETINFFLESGDILNAVKNEGAYHYTITEKISDAISMSGVLSGLYEPIEEYGRAILKSFFLLLLIIAIVWWVLR